MYGLGRQEANAAAAVLPDGGTAAIDELFCEEEAGCRGDLRKPSSHTVILPPPPAPTNSGKGEYTG